MNPMKIKVYLLLFTSILVCGSLEAQQYYRAEVKRADGYHIAFNIAEQRNIGKINWTILNGTERLEIPEMILQHDSLLVDMPFFEAQLILKVTPLGYEGQWLKRTSTGDQYMPITILRGKERYALASKASPKDFNGRWKAAFVNPAGKHSTVMAEFKQTGKQITGTFLTPTGDYRFLEGMVAGDSMVMSTFDGTHAFFFGAHMNAAGQIDRAVFASGPSHLETWTAQKDETASIDESAAAMQLKGDEHMLDFKFPDLDSNTVSLRDERFKGKVVVVQIMGSWCPNCMDETAFLSRFYRENKSRGVEVIGLAYEYTLDFARASKNLRRFKDKFQVEYPMLITGVLSSDPLRTEKTLPQMTPIKAFPSMIFLGKDGTVRKTHAGYSGPATGIHHEQFIRDFNAEINSLLGGN
jgi:thiol-disulfide isomerase/thioredoxin